MRIADLPRRARGVVVAHETDAGTAERLAALGLGVGAAFTVLREGFAPRILVGECRLGLGREIACAVRVLPS
jgi:Fe2+ transport system protein FeoA